jgi:hypothetical protein
MAKNSGGKSSGKAVEVQHQPAVPGRVQARDRGPCPLAEQTTRRACRVHDGVLCGKWDRGLGRAPLSRSLVPPSGTWRTGGSGRVRTPPAPSWCPCRKATQ